MSLGFIDLSVALKSECCLSPQIELPLFQKQTKNRPFAEWGLGECDLRH